MEIAERFVGDVLILDLKGRITLGYGDELLKNTINLIISQGHRKVILNFEAVPYIDSAGLEELTRGYCSFARNGAKVKLLNVSKRITDLLVITKLITIFEVYEDESVILAAFN